MPVYVFERVKRHMTKYVPCRGCGRPLRRSATFEQTINPFNKGADGVPKTREQIGAELDDQVKGWYPANDICRTCEILVHRPIGGIS
jgi:hypothetical protein